MVGTRQLERVRPMRRKAKVVLVGDPQRLQSIEAGAAFRSIHERHGGVETTVRRQRETGSATPPRFGDGKNGPRSMPMTITAWCIRRNTRAGARGPIDRWDRERQASPDGSRIILTHTNVGCGTQRGGP